MRRTWFLLFNLNVKFKTVWLCEKDPKKIKFLKQQLNPEILVSDFSFMSADIVRTVDGEERVVLETHILLGGFPCVQKSKLNPSRAQYKRCIQEGVGPTGEACDANSHVHTPVDA